MTRNEATITGERILLRPFAKRDAQDIYEGARDYAVSRWTFIPRPYTIESAYQFIRIAQKHRRAKKAFHHVIVLKETGRVIGGTGLMDYFPKHKRGEVGLWVARKYWGHGYASEALELMLEFCFKEMGLQRVVAGVFVGNDRSQRMVEKAGFTLEGLFRRHIKQRGRWLDLLRYGYLREEWQAHRKR
jgi:ribosomal-protein-alanine N-acetyltransferase